MGDIKASGFGGIPYGDNAGRPSSPELGRLYSNGEAQRLELYTSTGWNNIVQEVPGVSSITGVYNESSASNTITVYGSNFATGSLVYAIGSNGVESPASSVTFNSLVQLTAVFSDLSTSLEPYDIKVVNPSNLFGILPDALYINNTPTWNTVSGSLGTYLKNTSVSVSLSATDQEGTSIVYSSSNLPNWLSLNSSTGQLSGTSPSINQPTTYTFLVTASDGVNSSSRSFSFLINDLSPVWVTSSPLPEYSKNSAYSTQLSATDPENGALSYSLQSGSLPTGITLSSSGLLSGTPSSSSNTSFVIRVSDVNSNYADRSFVLNNTGVSWVTASGALTGGSTGVAYTTTLTATDDSGVVAYSVTSGALPTGLSLNTSTGVISGTPTSRQNFSFTIQASDPNGAFVDRSFSINVKSFATSIEYLLIAGGGGTSNYGGGGGAGGVLNGTFNVSLGQTYPVTVGAGGVSNTPGSGQNSTVFNLTAIGGGAGGLGQGNGTNGSDGGSGGGGGGGNESLGGSPTSGQGNAGGRGATGSGGFRPGGGGGGAGGAGSNGTAGQAGNGGSSTASYSAWASHTGTGVSNNYAGGGGGGHTGSAGVGNGGGGGAGQGGSDSGGVSNGSAVANTGSGAGGGISGGTGGSGIVILRHSESFDPYTSTSATVTTAGGYRYYIYNSSGNLVTS
jgi:hypothetical protein